MKLRSVRNLYLVKQSIIRLKLPEESSKKLIELINSTLLAEGGAKAVLYPYNSLEQQIVHLWGEGMKPKDIAVKLGILDSEGNPDTLVVENTIEDQSNYEDIGEV